MASQACLGHWQATCHALHHLGRCLQAARQHQHRPGLVPGLPPRAQSSLVPCSRTWRLPRQRGRGAAQTRSQRWMARPRAMSTLASQAQHHWSRWLELVLVWVPVLELVWAQEVALELVWALVLVWALELVWVLELV